MNTECMYVLTKENTVDGAKEFAKYLEKLAIEKGEEVVPTYISVITEPFKITRDYDGFSVPFKVKPGDMVVWAYGKDYCMYRIRPKGARMGFPYALNPDHSFNDKLKDLYVVERDKNYSFVGFREANLIQD